MDNVIYLFVVPQPPIPEHLLPKKRSGRRVESPTLSTHCELYGLSGQYKYHSTYDGADLFARPGPISGLNLSYGTAEVNRGAEVKIFSNEEEYKKYQGIKIKQKTVQKTRIFLDVLNSRTDVTNSVSKSPPKLPRRRNRRSSKKSSRRKEIH